MALKTRVEHRRNPDGTPSGLIKKITFYEADEKLFKDGEDQESLNKAKIQVSSGKWFYVDPVSRADIADAINIGIDNNIIEQVWKLAEPINGSKYVLVTMDEMKEARYLGLQYKGALVGAVV